MKSTTYHTVTETILQALRAGTPPWVKPWSTVAEIHPSNALSKRPSPRTNIPWRPRWVLLAQTLIRPTIPIAVQLLYTADIEEVAGNQF